MQNGHATTAALQSELLSEREVEAGAAVPQELGEWLWFALWSRLAFDEPFRFAFFLSDCADAALVPADAEELVDDVVHVEWPKVTVAVRTSGCAGSPPTETDGGTVEERERCAR